MVKKNQIPFSLGKALVLSPFATHPLDAGQRKRAHQTTRLFRDLGFDITFLHFAFESRWYWGHNDVDDTAIKSQWGNDVIHFYAHKQVGLPPLNGSIHQLDEWWDDSLGGLLSNIFSKRSYDLFVVHNIWLSKAFDYAPYDTLKILEMHDLFSQRAPQFRQTGVEPEFFYCSEEDELFGLRRSDVALAIKSEDATWCQTQGIPEQRLITIPYSETSAASPDTIQPNPAALVRPIASGKVVFGVIGSDIHFNRFAVRQLIHDLESAIRLTYAPIELVLAGSICKSVGQCPSFVRKLGFVDHIDDFYSAIDIVIVPMTHGTGVKIKSVEAIAQSKPILFAAHSAEGTGYDAQVYDSLADLAKRAAEIALESVIPKELVDATRRAHTNLSNQLEQESSNFLSLYHKKRPGFLYVLSPLESGLASNVLDATLGLLLFKQLSSWFRPLGLAIHPDLSTYLPSIPASTVSVIADSESLREFARHAQFIVVSMNDVDLALYSLPKNVDVLVFIDCRAADMQQVISLAETRCYTADYRLSLLVSPWVYDSLPLDCRPFVVVLPLLNDRLSWDPHLAFVRDIFFQVLTALPATIRDALCSELSTLGCLPEDMTSEDPLALDLAMANAEFKESILAALV